MVVKTPLKITTLKKIPIKKSRTRDSRLLHKQTKRGSQKLDAMSSSKSSKSFSPSKARRLFSPRGGARGGRHAGYGSRGHDSSTTKEGTKTEDDGSAFPNESTRLFSVDEDLKLAKMVRARGSWSPLRAFATIFCIGIVGMVCIYATYASEDVYDSSKEVLETEAREVAEAMYTREKFLLFGKDEGLNNRKYQRWELPTKLW